MVEAAEREGLLRPGAFLVESSSGNLGVALSMIAASRGYRFLCVTDSRCNLATRLLMEALGAQVHIVTEPDPVGGLLGARMNHIKELCADDDRVRLDQPVHQRQRLEGALPHHGAGDRPAVPGPGRAVRRRRHHRHPDGLRPLVQAAAPSVRIVAVDPVGSVSFGAPAARRMIPGLGMDVRPPLLDPSFIDEVIYVEEADTIRTCHRLARRGFLFGGSTGTVVSGATSWLDAHDATASPPSPSPPTSASATSTPSTRPTGWPTSTATTSSARRSWTTPRSSSDCERAAEAASSGAAPLAK